MFSTDFLGLSDQKVLKAIRDTLPKNLNHTQNILIISDGVLFAWDFDSSCVLTLNVRSARSKEGDGGVSYQVSSFRFNYKRNKLNCLYKHNLQKQI